MATYVSPPLNSQGLAARTGLKFMGRLWGNNSGQTRSKNVPYAIGLDDSIGALRTELHDTTWDHGLTDPDFKRRAEIGSHDEFKNGQEYWGAFSFRTFIQNLNAKTSVRLAQPFHWPSGASPAFGLSLVCIKGQLALRVTKKTDSSGNVAITTVTLGNDNAAHDLVFNTKMAAGGFLHIWLDRKQITNFNGAIGSTKEDGYSFRLGNYGVLNGAQVVTEYRNIDFLNGHDLSSRIAAPLSF